MAKKKPAAAPVEKAPAVEKQVRPAYIPDAVEKVADVSSDDMVAKASQLRTMRDRKGALEAELKDLNKELDALSNDLAELMIAKGVDNLRVAEVGLVYIQRVNHPYIADKPAFFDFLRSAGDGAMIKEEVHPSTLRGWVNDWLKNGNQLPESLNNFIQPKALLRK